MPSLTLAVVLVIDGLEWATEPMAQTPFSCLDPTREDYPLAPLLSLGKDSNTVRVGLELQTNNKFRGFYGYEHPYVWIDWQDPDDDSVVYAALNSCRIAGLRVCRFDADETLFALFDALAIPTLHHLDLERPAFCGPWGTQLDTYISKVLDYLQAPRACGMRTLCLDYYLNDFPALLALALPQPRTGFSLQTVCLTFCEKAQSRHRPRYPAMCYCEEFLPTGEGNSLDTHFSTISQVVQRNTGLNRRAQSAALRMLVVGRILFHAKLKANDAPRVKRGHATRPPLFRLPPEILDLMVSYSALDNALTTQQVARVLAHARDRPTFRRIAATFAMVDCHLSESRQRARDEWLNNGGIKWDLGFPDDDLHTVWRWT